MNCSHLKATYTSGRTQDFIVPDTTRVIDLSRVLASPSDPLKRLELIPANKDKTP